MKCTVFFHLKRIFKFAQRKGYITTLPLIDHLRVSTKEIKRLTTDQIKILLDNAPEKIKRYICMMVFTGMRPNEMMNLRWEDVNMIKWMRSEISEKRNSH